MGRVCHFLLQVGVFFEKKVVLRSFLLLILSLTLFVITFFVIKFITLFVITFFVILL